jgi:thiamine pyrophosphokinase
MTKCVILLGGDICATEKLKASCQNAIVIAADSGVRLAEVLGLKVDCWLGDFDSTSPALANKWKDLPRKTFPVEKAKTDGELAIEEGIARGGREFILVGAFGGARTDHALLHNFQALELARQGYEVTLTNGLEMAVPMLGGSQVFDLSPGTTFSVIGFGPLQGVHITGAKWPLSGVDVAAASSLTISNVATGPVTITIQSGGALVIISLS